MKRFLIPTDFSETSKNAAIFAAQMLHGKPGKEIILFYMMEGTDKDITLEEAAEDQDEMDILKRALEVLKLEMAELSNVEISTVITNGSSLVQSICSYVKHQGIDMVIMGITGASKLEQLLIGSNTLKLVHEGVCPVMIIPPDATFNGIKTTGFTSDFKNVDHTTPVAPIKKLLDLFNPKMYIINVDVEHYVEITDEYKIEREKLATHFSDYDPEFAFMRLYDFPEAINMFANDKVIDFIITVPKSHGFLSSIFHSSTTKKLAYHSHVPIVAIHE